MSMSGSTGAGAEVLGGARVRRALAGLVWGGAAGTVLCGGILLLNPRFLDSWPAMIVYACLPPGLLGALGAAAWGGRREPAGERAACGPRSAGPRLARVAGGAALLLLGSLGLHALSSAHRPPAESDAPKVILIGLDGASWKVIADLRGRGRLPHLSALIERGASGVLASEEPTISPAVWTTIATGKGRGKHGITSFFSPQRLLKAKRVWEILEERGRSAGVVGWMVTWPPNPAARGFLIPSHLARGPETLPPELGFVQTLIREGRDGGRGGPARRIALGLEGIRRGLRISTASHALQEWVYEKVRDPSYLDRNHRQQRVALEIYRDLFTSLRSRYRPDFSAVVFYGTDTLAHKYWRYYQPDLFEDTDLDEIERYREVIPAYYEAVDRVIGEIVASADSRTTVLVVSDHGTRGMEGRRIVRLPRLNAESLLARLGMAGEVEVTTVGNQAFVHPRGDSDERRAEILERVAQACRSVRVEGSGAAALDVERVDLAGEAGDYVGVEFSLGVGDGEPVSLETRLALPGGGSARVAEVATLDFPVSGTHDTEGVLIAAGPEIRGGTVQGARIADIAPTILYLMGLPVARDMDGEVLWEAIRPEHAGSARLQYVDSYGGIEAGGWRGEEEALGEEARRELRSLGYIN